MNILLIEPDVILARIYKEALQQAGYHIKIVHTAQSAIYQLDKSIPELIIIELQMANHNGVEFLYELKSYPEWQEIPVVVHSFIPKQSLKSSAVRDQLGIEKFLYKPTTSLQQLVSAIRHSQPIVT